MMNKSELAKKLEKMAPTTKPKEKVRCLCVHGTCRVGE